MASKIHWTDETWNPSVGCTRVSSGCDRCYAFTLHDRRYAANKAAAVRAGSYLGPNLARTVGVRLPFPKQYDLPFSKLQLLPDRLDQPLHWRKPRRVFVDSMSDLFHEEVPDEFIGRIFGVMALAREHSFQVLTKRPRRMLGLMADKSFIGGAYLQAQRTGGAIAGSWPLPNVWLGVSVENQETADERIPVLLETPAAVRFVSAEPLLGPVELGSFLPATLPALDRAVSGPRGNCVDWLIVGGETGLVYRPMDLDWARSLRAQCQAAGVPLFYKQGSGPRPGMHRELDGRRWEEFP